MSEEEEELGRKQTAATKKKIAKAVMGPKNPAFKDGRRSYRRKAGLKPNDGKAVHHKNNDSKDNKSSNLEVYKNKGPQRSKHEVAHDRAKNFKSSGGRKIPKRGYVAKRKSHGKLKNQK